MPGFTFVTALAALAGAAPATTRVAPLPPATPAVAAAQVAACGFKSVRPRFEEALEEDVVEVLDVTPASEEQLRCAALASLASTYYVVFPAALQQAYEPLYRRLSDEQAQTAARAWLARRGLLARLPTFDAAGANLASFARSLESLCGRRAAGTIQPMHDIATFTPGALGTLTKRGFARGKLDEETLACLLNASIASGYPLGFIGNGPAE